MLKNITRILAGLAVVGVMVFYIATFQVEEGRMGVVTRFGRPVHVVKEAGLCWKWPWPFERVIIVDGRRMSFNTRHTEMLTRDKKNIVLLSYAVWRVDDPLKFYQSIGSYEGANSKLDGLITNAKINVLGKYDLSALVSTNEGDLKVGEIEDEILEMVVEQAKEKYGIIIEQVGFKRLSLPEDNVKYVFAQMRAERAQYAARYRAEGEREASKIRSGTDLEAARIRAEASEEAARIRGDAEAEAAKIYSEAHQLDPDFFEFYRSMESLNQIIGSQTTLILRTDSAPFSFLKSKNP
ncbi:protease modulator HflC [bacterium]